MDQKIKSYIKLILKIVGKSLTFLILPFLGYGFGLALWQIVPAFEFQNTEVVSFAIGFGLFTVFWLIFRRPLQVVCTLEHEITHLLFALLFLKRPHAFVVTMKEGGHVKLSGGNFLITLAPYFFPTISYILLPIAFFIPKQSMPVYLMILGASVAFHLVSTWRDLHWEQSDLHNAGILFSLVFLPVANLIFYGALLALAIGGPEKFLSFWTIGVRESIDFFSVIFEVSVY